MLGLLLQYYATGVPVVRAILGTLFCFAKACIPIAIHRSLIPLQSRLNLGNMQLVGLVLELRVSGNRACFYSFPEIPRSTPSLPAKTRFSPRNMQFYIDPGSQFTLRGLDFGRVQYFAPLPRHGNQ